MEKIVANLRSIISNTGLKYKAVAEQSGINVGRFYRIIQGSTELTCDEIASLCRTLNITPNELYGITRRKG